MTSGLRAFYRCEMVRLGMREVVIVGGGIVGLLSALELTKREISVLVIDDDDRGQASWAGGGILSPLYAWRYSDAMNLLTYDAMKRYLRLCDTLSGFGFGRADLHQGGLWVHVADAEMDTAQCWAQKWGVRYGIRAGDSLIAGFPYSDGIFFPELGNIRNPRLLKALRGVLISKGVRFIKDRVVSLSARQRGASLETRLGARLDADRVLINAGAGSGCLLTMLGLSLPLFPAKGEMLLYQLSPKKVPSVMLTEAGYLIPRSDGSVLVGSTLRHGDASAYPTVAGRYQLENMAGRLLPELAGAKPLYHWAGVRPGSQADHPYIGAVPGCSGVFAAIGHYRNGLVAAPASAELVAQLMCKESTSIDPQLYSLPSTSRSRSSFLSR